MNIFIYWMGDEKIKKKIEEKFSLLSNKYNNIKIHIGPTEEEHNYLMKIYKYYKDMCENNKYGFSSDVYRFWKLSTNKGFYIDANSVIDIDRFDQIINLIDEIDNKSNKSSLFIKENGHLIWTGCFYSQNNQFFEKILDFYKKFPNVCKSLTGPLILSIFIYREFGVKLNNNEDIYYWDARDIDPFSEESIIKYNGYGSWGKNKKISWDDPQKSGAHTYFHNNAINFDKNKYKTYFWLVIRWCIKNYLIYLLPYIKLKKIFKK